MGTLVDDAFRNDFAVEDSDLAELAHGVRKALREGKWQAERALYELERRTARRLAELRGQASAVADANVRIL